MMKSGVILIFVFLVVAMASLIQNASAEGCSACSGKVPDWTETATDFLNGKVADTTPQLSGPKGARAKNEKFNSEFNSRSNSDAKNDLAKNDSIKSGAITPKIEIDLLNISAEPNPAIAGSALKISAVFGEGNKESLQGQADGRNRTTNGTLADANEADMTAWTSIRNKAGEEVGKLILEPISRGEYVGIWNANVAAGTYAVDVTGSGKNWSRSFNDSMQIEINKAPDATGDADASGKKP